MSGIGCGDSSCVFAVLTPGGMKTNGGCRCFDRFRHWDAAEGMWNDAALRELRMDVQRLARALREERTRVRDLEAQLAQVEFERDEVIKERDGT